MLEQNLQVAYSSFFSFWFYLEWPKEKRKYAKHAKDMKNASTLNVKKMSLK